ncbi:hypothetical protein E2C01_055243 [Portunus trituberculatus]|uniref:Uncharacterized protein n=1 Tax=Portunus trituberculatus TaxID=210409 RepID=A0A5B7GUB1_PORTR|nr:hypothetical protein [Portunus trituberculatus]
MRTVAGLPAAAGMKRLYLQQLGLRESQYTPPLSPRHRGLTDAALLVTRRKLDLRRQKPTRRNSSRGALRAASPASPSPSEVTRGYFLLLTTFFEEDAQRGEGAGSRDGRGDYFPGPGVLGRKGGTAGESERDLFACWGAANSSCCDCGQGAASPLILCLSGDAAGHLNESQSSSALRRTVALLRYFDLALVPPLPPLPPPWLLNTAGCPVNVPLVTGRHAGPSLHSRVPGGNIKPEIGDRESSAGLTLLPEHQ